MNITGTAAELADLTSLPAIRLQFKLKGTSYQHYIPCIFYANYTWPMGKSNDIRQGKHCACTLFKASIRFLTHVVSGYSGKDESRFQSGFFEFWSGISRG